MTKANYSKRERQWNTYHRLEQKRRLYFLKKLSKGRGFNLLNELHEFMHKSGTMRGLNRLGTARLKILADVHSIFGRVKG